MSFWNICNPFTRYYIANNCLRVLKGNKVPMSQMQFLLKNYPSCSREYLATFSNITALLSHYLIIQRETSLNNNEEMLPFRDFLTNMANI